MARELLTTDQKVEAAMKIVASTNQSPENLYGEDVADAFRRSLDIAGVVELIQFTCPPIQSRFLATDTPELYIDTDPARSNFDIGGAGSRLQKKIIKALRDAQVDPKLQLVIGDDDEDQYLFPILGKPATFNDEVLVQRKDQFEVKLSPYLEEKFPSIPFELNRTSMLTALCEDIAEFDPEKALAAPTIQADLRIETAQLQAVFQAGGYYDGYPLPRNADLRQVAEAKFLTYGRQGYSIKFWYPNGVLIQNEFPLPTRSRMINLVNDQLGEPLPVIYPYSDRTGR